MESNVNQKKPPILKLHKSEERYGVTYQILTTKKGCIVERYIANLKSKLEILSLVGLNITPRTKYFGHFPFNLAKELNANVSIVYELGCSVKFSRHFRRFTQYEAEQQFFEGFDVVKGFNGKIVIVGVPPVYKPDCYGLLANVGQDFNTISKQAVEFPVGVVKGLAAAERYGLVQVEKDFLNDLVAMTFLYQPVGEQLLFYVAVAFALLPISEIGIVEHISEEGDHTLLGEDLLLADGAHLGSSDLLMWPPPA